MLTLFLVFGIAFEVPIAVIVLVRIGVVSIEQLKKARGYFIVGAFIVAAVVTPPDVISQLALAIPMCILYELGIVAAQIFAKQTQAPDAAAETPATSPPPEQRTPLRSPGASPLRSRVPRLRSQASHRGVAKARSDKPGGSTSPRC